MDFSIFKSFRRHGAVPCSVPWRKPSISTNFTVFSQPDVSIGDSKAYGGNGNFGVITSSVAGTERHLQFSLRLMF